MFPFLSLLSGGCSDEGDFITRHESEDRHAGIGAAFAVSFDRFKNETSVRVGTWYIVSVPENSAAFDAGLIAGDTVLQVFSVC